MKNINNLPILPMKKNDRIKDTEYFNTKSNVNLVVLWDGTDIWYRCEEEGCNYESKRIGNLKQHLWHTHNIGDEEMFKCDQEECNYECKFKGSLTQHLWQVHSIGNGEIVECEEEGCNATFKRDACLKRHLKQVHNIGDGEIFICEEKGCDFNCKSKSHLKEHLWQVHDIGNGEILECEIEGCKHKTKRKTDLKKHLWQVHNIGEGEIFECEVEDCVYKTKRKGDLNIHLWRVHNIGEGEIFECEEEGCNFETKRKCDLKTHLSGVHDIGDIECNICLKNVSKISEFIDPKSNNILNGCRKCCNKITGYSSRIEKIMVEFLKNDENINPYIILEDRIIKGTSCSTKCRPDLLIGTPGLSIFTECDENAHRDYEQSCEMSRMDKLFDEVSGQRAVFIRWNPHLCKKNGIKYDISIEARLIALRDLILEISYGEVDDNILVYYMYYDENNEVITNRHPKKLIY